MRESLRKVVSRGPVVVALVALAVFGSACLVAPQSPTVVFAGNGPDPSWVPVYYGAAEVYTTDSIINGNQWAHVPTYITPIPNPHATGAVLDALPTLPSLSGPSGDIWAPSVRSLAGEYVMVFSESVPVSAMFPNGHGNCIGWAVSTTGQGFTPNNGLYWCSANPSIGYLDPYIFVNPNDGTVWLIYSQQGAALASVGGSQIVTHQMNSNGLGFAAGSQDDLLVPYSAVSSFNSSEGSMPEIENPSMTSDDYNGYDLTFSLGTWGSNAICHR